MGYIADKYSKRNMIVAGGILVAISLLTLIWAEGFWSMLISISLFGIGGGLSMPPLMAIGVVCGTEEKAMGSVMAILTLAQSLGMMLGSVIAGLVMDYLGLKYSFPLATIIMIIGTILFIICIKKPVSSQPQPLNAK